MIGTPHLLLSIAAHSFREGYTHKVRLDGSLTPAQAGAALRLSQVGALELLGKAKQDIAEIQAEINTEFTQVSIAGRYINDHFDDLSGLEKTIGQWILHSSNYVIQAKIGYWLMGVFLRRLDKSETLLFTKFLIGPENFGDHKQLRRSVRRYPTGGISEKQALILPAFLRYVCDRLEWCSPFLVARRLAHTGGTRDKLSTLPGMKLVSSADLRSWNGTVLPVQYFAAGADYCYRDAELYRFRGETGTVRDHGLMASSIMSKQIAFPADVIILDVLYGNAAFIENLSEAEDFISLCEWIGYQYGISIVPYYRSADGMLGQCIGNILEVWEAAQLLKDAKKLEIPTASLNKELRISLEFMEIFAKNLQQDASKVYTDCLEGLRSGAVYDALLQLWSEHGVEKKFLELVYKNPRDALVGKLNSALVLSSTLGFVKGWDSIAIADLVNNKLNSYFVNWAGQISGCSHGGIEIVVKPGEFVSCGSILAVLYGDKNLIKEVSELVKNLFEIQQMSEI